MSSASSSGKETQLTTDGVKDFSYALDNAGWEKSDRPILLWSPDSRKIASFQQDQRNVGDMYLVETKVGHPTLQSWKYPLPGDDSIATIQRVVIDVETQKVVRLQMPPDPHRSTLCDDVACGSPFEEAGNWTDVEWSPDSAQLFFVSTSRDHKQETLRAADPASGAVHDVMEERVATQYESGQGSVNWRVFPASNEFIWYSERDNWGHLYLYDLATGKLKNRITSGDWVVTKLRMRSRMRQANAHPSLRSAQSRRVSLVQSTGSKLTVAPTFCSSRVTRRAMNAQDDNASECFRSLSE
jgi:hypothetical protein